MPIVLFQIIAIIFLFLGVSSIFYSILGNIEETKKPLLAVFGGFMIAISLIYLNSLVQ